MPFRGWGASILGAEPAHFVSSRSLKLTVSHPLARSMRNGRRPPSTQARVPYFTASGPLGDLGVIASLAETPLEDEPGSRLNG
jgi:hypothetical protein